MRLAVVKLLVVMASEVSDPEVMKQDRPETSHSKSRTQPVSSPSVNKCLDVSGWVPRSGGERTGLVSLVE